METVYIELARVWSSFSPKASEHLLLLLSKAHPSTSVLDPVPAHLLRKPACWLCLFLPVLSGISSRSLSDLPCIRDACSIITCVLSTLKNQTPCKCLLYFFPFPLYHPLLSPDSTSNIPWKTLILKISIIYKWLDRVLSYLICYQHVLLLKHKSQSPVESCSWCSQPYTQLPTWYPCWCLKSPSIWPHASSKPMSLQCPLFQEMAQWSCGVGRNLSLPSSYLSAGLIIK